ncbi:MAG TPA: hypothetical protein VFS16_15465, partial [Acidimicrobiia bacterium]|nr:hypothetical protein [Acidimicrobiia bacterium]
LAHSPGAAAADPPRSSVAVTDPTGDTMKGDVVVPNQPAADITAASARYQNDFVTFTMKLLKGDGLSDADSRLFWIITTNTESCCENIVSIKKGANGLQIVMGDPDAPLDPADPTQQCANSTLSHDIAAGTYIAAVHTSCISPDPLPSFMWRAIRQIGPSSEPVSDFAPDSTENSAAASAVTNTKVSGYWAIGSDGKVYGFGDAIKTGEPVTTLLNTVDIESSPHGTGYWTLNDLGAVNAYGPIGYGSLADGALQAGERAVSMSSTPSGAGYWIFTNKGRAIGFGDADKNIGDVSKIPLNAEVLDSAAMPSGKGYYLVAADGGVFALGDAKFEGSMGDTKLNQPVQSIVPDPDGQGYWLVASDGGVFAFKAVFRGSTGSMKLNKPMTGMVPFGNGYLMVAEDGGVFNYSDRPFSGSLGNNPPANPIVSIAALN